MTVSKKQLLALADRIDGVESYSGDELGAVLVRLGGQKKKGVRVILVNEVWREQLAASIRATAGKP